MNLMDMNHLDAEFDNHLASMKKFILNLKDRKCKSYLNIRVTKDMFYELYLRLYAKVLRFST
jgi:hypothetical protein